MLRKLIPDVVDGQKLVKLPAAATVCEAASAMAKHNVRSVLVVDRDRLLGIFTGTDLIQRVVAAGLDPKTTRLSRVMTKNPDTACPGDCAIDALSRMHRRRYRHLPVLDHGKLVGILSRRDFLAYEVDEIDHQERIWERL
jgi:CBS domain-containing protein